MPEVTIAGVKAQLELTVPALRAMVATASYRLLATDGVAAQEAAE